MSRHDDAVAAAAEVLAARGFARGGELDWYGSLSMEAGLVSVRVGLTKRFPFCLPEISVDRLSLATRLPHVEKSGRLCLVAPNGIRLDVERPGQLVEEALARASKILRGGSGAAAESEVLREFQAYWGSFDAKAASICRVNDITREVLMLRVVGGRRSGSIERIFADDFRQYRNWAGRLGVSRVTQEKALFVACERPFLPPDWDEKINSGRLVYQILDHAESRSFLSRTQIAANTQDMNVLLSLPVGEDGRRTLVACEVPLLAKRALRRHSVSLPCLIARKEIPIRYNLSRLDSGYLLERAGGITDLLGKKVTVVGCGSVGSALASQLAGAGIGYLRLIDPESLESGNVHRHSCGVRFVGLAKVKALELQLGEQFTHIAVEPFVERVEDLLERHPTIFTSSDLVVVALGDETAELWLNEYLPRGVPRLHVWVEAYGLGGHVLELGRCHDPGCYRCLFGRASNGTFSNRALLAADNQSFARSITGCAGTFTPYGAADAIRAACEGQRAAIRILRGAATNQLTSWMTDSSAFIGQGYTLSARGCAFKSGEMKVTREFATDSECPRCQQ